MFGVPGTYSAPGDFGGAPMHSPDTTSPSVGYGGTPQVGGLGGYSAPEQEYYQQLFAQADPHRTGYLDGLAAANLLSTSELPQDVLRTIWEIADASQHGSLPMDRFFVACRLVAHAQAGHPPSPDLAMQEPRALPDFQGLQRQRAPSETSPVGSPAPSVGGGAHSDTSELQPVIAGGEEQVRRAAQAARTSRSPSPAPFTADRWAPSQREKRKYATLFKRTDWDNDGYVQGHEALDLLERSRLDRTLLRVAWEHADQGRDGKLNFREFVCLVHLVTCALRGAHMPEQHEPLPAELTQALAHLESPDALVAEREASRSRSASPMPSGFATPTGASGTRDADTHGWGQGGGDLGTDAPGFGVEHAFDSGGAPDFGVQSKTLEMDGDFGFGANGFKDGGDVFGSKKTKKKKDKKDDAFGVSEQGVGTMGGRWSDPSFGPGGDDPFGAPSRGRSGRRLDDLAQHELSAAAQQFEAVIAADHEVSRQLRREVDELHDEMKHMQEARGQLQHQVLADQHEEGTFLEQRAQVEQQLDDAKRRLAELRDDRRAVNLESLSLRRDRGHFAEELNFLSHMVEDEEHTLEVIRSANGFLEKSYRDLEIHTEVLEDQRKQLLQHVAKERELVRYEERNNAELRNRLDQLRREHAASMSDRKEAQLREQKIRAMQTPGVASQNRLGGHSWAKNIAVSGKVGSVPKSSGPLLATRPPAGGGRAGV